MQFAHTHKPSLRVPRVSPPNADSPQCAARPWFPTLCCAGWACPACAPPADAAGLPPTPPSPVVPRPPPCALPAVTWPAGGTGWLSVLRCCMAHAWDAAGLSAAAHFPGASTESLCSCLRRSLPRACAFTGRRRCCALVPERKKASRAASKFSSACEGRGGQGSRAGTATGSTLFRGSGMR